MNENEMSGACERFCDVLRSHIGEGKWWHGSALPKITYFMKEYGVSNHTVTTALRQLAAEGTVHKKGKSWFVGRMRPSSTSRGYSGSSPVVALVIRRPHSWANLLRSERAGTFAFTFQNEAARQHVVLQPVLADASSDTDRFFPEGREEGVKALRALGARYKGALISGSVADISGFREWCETLLSLGKPVAWFDQHELPPPEFLKRNRVLWCHISEENAVRCALKGLADAGHHTAAYVSVRPSPWSVARYRMLEKLAPEYRITVSTPGPEGWSAVEDWICWYRTRLCEFRLPELPEPLAQTLRTFDNLQTRLADLIRALPTNEMPGTRVIEDILRTDAKPGEVQFRAGLILYTPAMIALLRNRPSAIMGANDAQTRFAYNWLKVAGIPVPASMSMISFDNVPESTIVPVSTVDFGFTDLGYRAFHYILRDLPVKGQANGSMPSVPQLIDRGSIARR